MGYAYILDAVRTPRGRGKAGKGALSGIHPQELFAQTLRQAVTRSGVAAMGVLAGVQHVVISGGQGVATVIERV